MMIDGNTYAINRHLAEREAYDRQQELLEAERLLPDLEERIEELEAALETADWLLVCAQTTGGKAEARFIEQRDSLVSVTKKLTKTEAKLAKVIKKWSAAESEAYDLRAALVQQATKGGM